jgi:hypothetical protein
MDAVLGSHYLKGFILEPILNADLKTDYDQDHQHTC